MEKKIEVGAATWNNAGDISHTPEVSLWRSVVVQAVNDAMKGSKTVMFESWWWLFKSDGYFNSFPVLCSFISENPINIREMIVCRFLDKVQFSNSQEYCTTILRRYAKEIRRYGKAYYEYVNDEGRTSQYGQQTDPDLYLKGLPFRIRSYYTPKRDEADKCSTEPILVFDRGNK